MPDAADEAQDSISSCEAMTYAHREDPLSGNNQRASTGRIHYAEGASFVSSCMTIAYTRNSCNAQAQYIPCRSAMKAQGQPKLLWDRQIRDHIGRGKEALQLVFAISQCFRCKPIGPPVLRARHVFQRKTIELSGQ